MLMKGCVMTKTLLAAAAASLLLSLPAYAAEATAVDEKRSAQLHALCDADKDGMVSKAELMAHVEKAWNKADSAKKGMLDKKQVGLFMANFDPGKIGGN